MMNLDLNFANNILSSIINSTLTGVTSPFMQPLIPIRGRLKEYRNLIKEPISLNEMNDKMRNAEYQTIKEFVCDFRLMLFNAYRYFGCDSKMGKNTAKLEAMFEQKLLLLPIDIRMKTSMDAILTDDVIIDSLDSSMTRRRYGDRSYNTDIRMATPIKAMMEEMEKCGTISTMFSDNNDFKNDPMNFLIIRLNKWQEKRRTIRLLKQFDEWYTLNSSEEDRTILDNCPEFVEFLQFLNLGYYAIGLDQLLSESIKINHITIEDIKFAILFPQTSTILSAIVSLITTKAKNRLSVIKGPLPDYNQWNRDLAEQVSFLYKTWIDKRLSDKPHLFVKRYSIEPTFFKIFGNRKSPIDTKMFHELSVFQRCHLLLAMCYMTLRHQDSIHSSIDKSIEWDDNKKIVLSHVGEFEYVRFSGLGDYSSYYVYRIKVPQLEEELSNYSAQDIDLSLKRKRKEKPPNKFRLPNWYLNEVKRSKSQKNISQSKKKSIKQNIERITRSRRSTVVDDVIDNVIKEITEKFSDTVEATMDKIVQSDHCSDSPDEQDDNIIENYKDEVLSKHDSNEDEEEIPEICGPIDGELELLAKDLSGVMNLIDVVKTKMEGCKIDSEELESWKMLQENLDVLRIYFEDNESLMIERFRDGRLRLLQEVGHIEESNAVIVEENESEKSNEKTQEIEFKKNIRKSKRFKIKRQWRESSSEDDNSEEYNVEDDVESESNEWYTEAELKKTIRKSDRQRVKRHWREVSSDCDDDESVKLPKLTMNELEKINIPKINTDESSENCAPPLNSSLEIKSEPIDPQKKVKRKVFQIYNDFFTDELLPVRVKDDGSLESLPLNSVTEERYALARKMIDLYKFKLNKSVNGHVQTTVEATSGNLIK